MKRIVAMLLGATMLLVSGCNNYGGINVLVPRVVVGASDFQYDGVALTGTLSFYSKAGSPSSVVSYVIEFSNGQTVELTTPRLFPGCAVDVTNDFERENKLCRKVDTKKDYGLHNAILVDGLETDVNIAIGAPGITSAVLRSIEAYGDNGSNWGGELNLVLFKAN